MSFTQQNDLSAAEFFTSICYERPSDDNPFLAQERYIRGYRHRDLWQRKNFMEVLLLHFLGEMPAAIHVQVLETLFVGLMNLGPRDNAIRAAMVAAISKTRPEHLLPIGLLALQGTKNGTDEVEAAHQFIESHRPFELLCWCTESTHQEELQVHPGFGSVYGGIDPMMDSLAQDITQLVPNSPVLRWCLTLVEALRCSNQGWLVSGLVAAVCVELGIAARESVAIFQLARSVGIVVHGMEQSHQPLSRAPLLGDEFYELL